ncbi:MAG: secretin N-terminal domain-containing protein, partial [Limisphaerales bacterium]
MKLKLYTFALMGALGFQQSAMTQTAPDTNVASPTVPMTAPAASAAWPTNDIASKTLSGGDASGSNTTVTTGDPTVADAPPNTPAAAVVADAPARTNAIPAVAVAETNAPAPVVPAELAAVTNVPLPAVPVEAVAPPTNPALAAEAVAPAVDTNTAPSIPLIEFQDVPLTVAIENLARQANINYLLDPKIGYGQPDQNGQVKADPTLSIRWENVTAEQALLALLNNYDLQLIRDPKTAIGRITMKDPLAPPPLETRVIQLKYASVSNMVRSVQAAFTDRRSHVLPDARTSQLIVVATDPEQDAVDTLINDLDKPTRQVLIETKLVEVASTPATSKGINWSGTVAGQNISFGNGIAQAVSQTLAPGAPTTTTYPGGATVSSTSKSSTSTTITSSLQPQPSLLPGGLSWNTLTGLTPAIGFLNADGVQAVLSFLNSSYDAQTLSTPRVVTLDNETATISVTRM